MARITRIDVVVTTGTKSGAGTDGEVYIGIGGREFYLDSTADDFEAGSSRTYTLGVSANIRYASYNDPRNPQLETDDPGKYPVYLRFEPAGSGPSWNVERITVTVNPGPSQIRYDNTDLSGSPDIWLGQKYGKYIYLSRA